MFSKTIALAVFTTASLGFGVLLFAQSQDALPSSEPNSATPDSPPHPSPAFELPVPPLKLPPVLEPHAPPPPPLDLPGKARARQPKPPDVGERRARKETLAALRKKLSEFEGELEFPKEWNPVRHSLDSIIAAIRSDQRWAQKAAVQFARATVAALLADEEDKEALDSGERLLSLLQRDAKDPEAFRQAGPADLHEWLRVQANLNRIIAAQEEFKSAEAQCEYGVMTLDFVFATQRRLAEAKLEFARTAFAQFPFAENDVKGMLARGETLAFVEVKNSQAARDTAMETWARVYRLKSLGHREGTAYAEAQARQSLYAAEAKLQAVLASLRRKPGAAAEEPDTVVSKPDVTEEPKPATKKPETAEWQLPPDAPQPATAPFDADQANQHQQAWAEYRGVPVEITNSIGMKLKLIPAGEFAMGSPDSDRYVHRDERPRHRVRITKPFYLGATEVTQEQYEKVMGENPSVVKGPANPVETVSWDKAVEFCKRLSAKEGKKYRLPTEAEWEYACRAGSTTRYGFGDNSASLGEHAWHLGNSGRKMHPVGEKKPNAWGLYDMHGNAWEWCQDWLGEYSSDAVTDPQGPTGGSNRGQRGGSWINDAKYCRSANRWSTRPGHREYFLGFRVAGVPPGGLGQPKDVPPSLELPPVLDPPRPHPDLPGKARARQPAAPDADERRARKERLAAMRKKLSDFEAKLELPEDWKAVRDSLESIIGAIRSDDGWPRTAAVQFARATVVALLPDEEDKEALESKERLLSVLQRDAKAPEAFQQAGPADLHEWLRVQANLNRIFAAQTEIKSAEAHFQGGASTLDLVLAAQQRSVKAKLEFARTSFTQFPFVEGDVMGMLARDETLAFIEVKTYEEARDAATATWAIIYEMKMRGHTMGSAYAEAQARQSLYAAEAKLQAALASLKRKQKAIAEAEAKQEADPRPETREEVHQRVPRFGRAKLLLSRVFPLHRVWARSFARPRFPYLLGVDP